MKRYAAKTTVERLFAIPIFLLMAGGLSLACTTTDTYQKLTGVQRSWVNAEEKSKKIGEFTWFYNEHGQGEPIMLIHGFGADKDSWNFVVDDIKMPMRIVVPDLPAWGKTNYVAGKSYNFENQAMRLDEFRESLGMDKLHLVGWSMGGSIAGTYAALFPDRVKSLTLIDTGGIETPIESDYFKLIRQGKNPLIVKKPEDMDTLYKFIFHKDAPFLMSGLKGSLYDHMTHRSHIDELIFPDLVTDRNYLEPRLAKIKAPVQVIWGREDRIVDVSAVDKMKSLRPSIDIHILEEGGHAVVMDRAPEVAALIENFVLKNRD